MLLEMFPFPKESKPARHIGADFHTFFRDNNRQIRHRWKDQDTHAAPRRSRSSQMPHCSSISAAAVLMLSA